MGTYEPVGPGDGPRVKKSFSQEDEHKKKHDKGSHGRGFTPHLRFQ